MAPVMRAQGPFVEGKSVIAGQVREAEDVGVAGALGRRLGRKFSNALQQQ